MATPLLSSDVSIGWSRSERKPERPCHGRSCSFSWSQPALPAHPSTEHRTYNNFVLFPVLAQKNSRGFTPESVCWFLVRIACVLFILQTSADATQEASQAEAQYAVGFRAIRSVKYDEISSFVDLLQAIHFAQQISAYCLACRSRTQRGMGADIHTRDAICTSISCGLGILGVCSGS